MIPRIDASMIVDWLRCRELWRWRWRHQKADDQETEGIVVANQRPELEFGRSVARFVDDFYTRGRSLLPIVDLPADGKNSIGLLHKLCRTYASKYDPNDGFRLESERELEYQYTASSDFDDDAFILCGRLDGWNDECLVETKAIRRPDSYKVKDANGVMKPNTVDRWLMTQNQSIQIKVYLVLLLRNGLERRKVQYDFLFKNPPIDFDCFLRPEPYEYSRSDLLQMDCEIVQVCREIALASTDPLMARQLKSGIALGPPCSFYGYPCDYLDVCFGHPGPEDWAKFVPRVEHLEGRK